MHLDWRDVVVCDGVTIPTSLLAVEAEELARLAESRRVLEVGSAYGFSAVTMALAGATHVTAVDNHAGDTWLGDTRTVLQRNLDTAGVADRVTVVEADSRDGLAGLAGQKFGLIFIDGDHSYAGAAADIAGALPLLDHGGVLAIHDYGETCCCPEVKTAAGSMLPAPDRVVGTLWLKKF